MHIDQLQNIIINNQKQMITVWNTCKETNDKGAPWQCAWKI